MTSASSSQAPIIDPSQVKKAGFILKQGGKVQSWKNRYFILHDHFLYYYADKDQKEHLGSIPLKDCQISSTDSDATGHYFKINLPSSNEVKRNEYLLKSQTIQERSDWMSALIQANTLTIFNHPISRSLKVNPYTPGVYSTIPYFLIQAIQWIEKGNHLGSEGIYRLNGSSVQIDAVVNRINSNFTVDFSDLNVTTGLIKLYMRSLPEPLLLYKNYQDLKRISQLPDEKQAEPLRHIIRNLPISHFLLLNYVFDHLKNVLGKADDNKMNTKALSVCIGPSLIRLAEDDPNEAFGEANIQQQICGTLLTQYNDIFTDHPLMIYNSSGDQSVAKLIVEQRAESPFALSAPSNAVIHVLAEDSDGWAIAVYNDKWGVVHRDFLNSEVSPKEICFGFGNQFNKWKLEPSTIKTIQTKCPEAWKLYELQIQKLKALREKASHVK